MSESFNGELKKMQSILENDSGEFAVQPLLCVLQAIRVLALVTEYPTQWILPFFYISHVVLVAVFSRVESVQTELQAAVDWDSATEQPRRTVPSSQLFVDGKVQVNVRPHRSISCVIFSWKPMQMHYVAYD